jgi:hypothetical protein
MPQKPETSTDAMDLSSTQVLSYRIVNKRERNERQNNRHKNRDAAEARHCYLMNAPVAQVSIDQTPTLAPTSE